MATETMLVILDIQVMMVMNVTWMRLGHLKSRGMKFYHQREMDLRHMTLCL